MAVLIGADPSRPPMLRLLLLLLVVTVYYLIIGYPQVAAGTLLFPQWRPGTGDLLVLLVAPVPGDASPRSPGCEDARGRGRCRG